MIMLESKSHENNAKAVFHLTKMFLFLFYFETGSVCVVKAGQEPTILLPQPPESWDYRWAPPHLSDKAVLMAHCTHIFSG
jgi:hypothetical protein